MHCKANSQIVFLLCVLSFKTAQAQDSASDLQKSLFTKSSPSSCILIPPQSLKEGYPQLGSKLNTLINNLKSSIQKDKPEDLVPLFHPRLKMTEARLRGTLMLMKSKLKTPFEVSSYQVYALFSSDKSSKLLPCEGGEIHIHPLYGHTLQFGAWIQVLGQSELGRVFAHIVQDKGKDWKLGSFSYEQWTHTGKSAQDWYKLALSHAEKNPLLAFAELDIAAKLTDKTPHYELSANLPILSLQQQVLKREKWESTIKKELLEWKISYLGTTLAETGVGLAIRFEVAKELSTNGVREECQKLWAKIKNTKELSGFKGLRCSPLLAQEPAQKDGFMGFEILN